MWHLNSTKSQEHLIISLAPYWNYYQSACGHALHDGGRHTLARTHRNIIDLTKSMLIGDTRDALRDILLSKPTTKIHPNVADMADSALDLAASLLLMIDFRCVQHGYSGSQRLQWSQGSLEECVRSQFVSNMHLGHGAVKLPRSFNAQSLFQIARVEFVPTANLLDHLRLTDDDTKVYIFHHAAFLKLQNKGYVRSADLSQPCAKHGSSLIPHEIVEETLHTLALLFPQSNHGLRRWCRRLPQFHSMDPEVLSCGHLKTEDRQIESFVHWHDRLVVLKQVYDEATPRTLSQWWYDRRNGVQWWTFWIAILVFALTLFFGFIQSITGILQVYVAFREGSES